MRGRVLLQGWGVPFVPVSQGYGSPAAAGLLRETFRVPLPDGEVALRSAPRDQPAYLGSTEAAIAFGLDFEGWLGPSETLWAATVAVRAYPTATRSAPYDATATLVQFSTTLGSLVVVTFHQATPQTFYVTTVNAQTSAGRTLECRMPHLYCPD